MTTTFLSEAVLVDTSAAIALAHSADRFHLVAKTYFETTTGVVWAALNATAHEAYTRARYDLGFREALQLYDFLTGKPLVCMQFTQQDERAARELLVRFHEHRLSFHDALVAAVMKRLGLYRTFAFDAHFWLFGFEVVPGQTR